jgi:predicted DNA-binding transcriptional regulator AlpA
MSAEPAVRLVASVPDDTPSVVELHDHPAAGRPKSLAASVEPLLVPASDAARMCGLSEASWYRLKAAGKVPLPVRLGGRVFWRLDELRRWCAAGCPDLRNWQALESTKSGRGSGR